MNNSAFNVTRLLYNKWKAIYLIQLGKYKMFRYTHMFLLTGKKYIKLKCRRF